MYYKTRQIWVYFVCTLLLYTKVSASKVHSYTSTDFVWAPVWERSERKRTCSGIVYVTHNASVVIVSSVLQWWRQSKCALLLVHELSKQSALWHPSLWESPDPGLVSQWVQKQQDTNRNDIKNRGREDPKKQGVSPSSFFSLFIFPQCDWIGKSKP